VVKCGSTVLWSICSDECSTFLWPHYDLSLCMTSWRYVALVVVLWCPALSLSPSVTALRWESYQSTRHMVISSHGHVVTQSTRHKSTHRRRVFSQSTRDTVKSSHSHLVTSEHFAQSYGWAMLKYAGEADETGNGYIQLYLRQRQFFRTPRDQITKLRLWAQNSVGMQILKVTTNVQNSGALDP